MTNLATKTASLNDLLRSTGLTEDGHRLEMREHDISCIRGEDIEEPFRTVLVHSHDMTPTLERLIGRRIVIRVLWREIDRIAVKRQVLLFPEGGRDKPLVLGQIKINLANLTENARVLVRDEVMPFGSILRHEQIMHSNGPIEYLSIRLGALLSEHFGVDCGQPAYGRYRQMVDAKGATLAEVMEIASPEFSRV